MKKHIYCRHSFEIEVQFFDAGAMYIVWHGNYVKYLETARCAFLSAIGHNYNEMARQGYSRPIVQMNPKYIRPARFGQKIRVDMEIVEIESCLRIDYTIYDVETNEKLAHASTTQAAVLFSDGLIQFQMPGSWLEAVKRYPTFQIVWNRSTNPMSETFKGDEDEKNHRRHPSHPRQSSLMGVFHR